MLFWRKAMLTLDPRSGSTASRVGSRLLSLGLLGAVGCGSESLAPPAPPSLAAALELELVGRLPIGGQPTALVVVGPVAYVATRENGIQVIDITVPESPEILTTIRDITADRLAFSEDRLFALERGRSTLGLLSGGRLATFDVLDPKQPVALDPRSIEQANDVAANAARAVVAAGHRILVGAEGAQPLAIDAATGDRERVVATAWRGNRVAILTQRTTAWLGAATAECVVLEGRRPVKVGSLLLPASFSATDPNDWRIELTARSAWLAGSDRLMEIDLTDPKSPTIANDLPVMGLRGFALSGDHLAILGDEFRLLRRSDLERIPVRGVLPQPTALAATLRGDTLLVLDSERGLSILRLVTPKPASESPSQ